MKTKITFALLAVFLAASTLIIFAAEKESVESGKKAGIHRARGGDILPVGLTMLFRVADELELTNSQLLQLRMLYQKKSESEKKHLKNRALGRKLFEAKPSEEEVKKFAAEMAKKVESDIIARYKMQQELNNILTSEQCKKLEEIMAKSAPGKGLMPFGPMPFFRGDRKGPPMPPPPPMFSREGMKHGVHPFFGMDEDASGGRPYCECEDDD